VKIGDENIEAFRADPLESLGDTGGCNYLEISFFQRALCQEDLILVVIDKKNSSSRYSNYLPCIFCRPTGPCYCCPGIAVLPEPGPDRVLRDPALRALNIILSS
jgi:hypothetical protein